MLPPVFDRPIDALSDFAERLVDALFIVINVVLWPFMFVFDIVCWLLDLAIDVYCGFRELYDTFVPRSVFVDFVLSSGLGVFMFWIFGPGHLTLPFLGLQVAIMLAILAALFGLLTVPVALWTICEYFFSEEGTEVQHRSNFWGAGFVLFCLYAGFSLGYYLTWYLS